MPVQAFFSYRRSDAADTAIELHSLLSRSFSRLQLFLDADSIAPGSDFRVVLERSLKRCAVLFCVIGPKWLNAALSTAQRRLDDPLDYVRLEIATALRRGIPVIPLLIEGTKMPTAHDLPEDLRGLSFKQAIELPRQPSRETIARIEDAVRLHLGANIIDRTTMRVASAASILAPLLTLLVCILPGIYIANSLAQLVPPGPPGNNTTGIGHPSAFFSREFSLALWLSIPLLGAISIGAVGFAALLEFRYKGILKLIVLVTGYGLLSGVSFLNILANDTLVNLWAQLTLDIFQVVVSIYLLTVIWPIETEYPLLSTAKVVLIGLLVVFGISLPGLLAVMFLGYKAHVFTDFNLSPVQALAFVLAISAGLFALLPKVSGRN